MTISGYFKNAQKYNNVQEKKTVEVLLPGKQSILTSASTVSTVSCNFQTNRSTEVVSLKWGSDLGIHMKGCFLKLTLLKVPSRIYVSVTFLSVSVDLA